MEAILIALTTGASTSVVRGIIEDLSDRGLIKLGPGGRLDVHGWELTRLMAMVTTQYVPVPRQHVDA